MSKQKAANEEKKPTRATEGGTVHIGRPRELAKDARVITFRLSSATADAVAAKAARQGKSRSYALREAIEDWLAKE